MTKYRSPWLRTAALMCLLGFGSVMQAQETTDAAVTDKEIELIAEFSDTKFAYIPENIRNLILSLHDELKDHCSPELIDDLRHEAHIALYEDIVSAMSHVMQAVESKRLLMKEGDYEAYKNLLLSYDTSLQNGEALITAEPDTRSSNTKTVCSLIAKRKITASQLKVCGNAKILGNLTVGGATMVAGTSGITIEGATTINNLTVNGPLTISSSGTVTNPNTLLTGSGAMLSSSLIPFSSGLVTVSFNTLGIPSYMGFGSSSINGPNFAVGSPIETSYAFTVPQAGTLHHLQATVDALYAASAFSAPQVTYTFTLLKSPCNAGTGCQSLAPNPYTATSLSTTVCFAALTPSPSVMLPFSACNQNNGSISVAAGDRIVLQLTSNPSPVPRPSIFALAFSAGLFFTPA
jgi:hypothetical protein